MTLQFISLQIESLDIRILVSQNVQVLLTLEPSALKVEVDDLLVGQFLLHFGSIEFIKDTCL